MQLNLTLYHKDMEIYRRCSAFERFLSLYSSPSLPAPLRKMIIRIIFRATHVDGSTTLVTRSGILSWIQVQIMLKDPNDVILKLLAERCLETCDLGRIDDWGGETIASNVQSSKTSLK